MRFRGKIIAALLGGAALGAPAMATTLQDAFVQTYTTSPALNTAQREADIVWFLEYTESNR